MNKVIVVLEPRISTVYVINVKIRLTGLRVQHSSPEDTKRACAQVPERITRAGRQEVPVDMNELAFQ